MTIAESTEKSKGKLGNSKKPNITKCLSEQIEEMKTRQSQRIDQYHGVKISNESSKLPGHEERMKEHEKRIQDEYCKIGAKMGMSGNDEYDYGKT